MTKKLSLLFTLMLSTLIASADVININDIYYNLDFSAKTAEVTSNPNYYSGSVVIPASVTFKGSDYKVTSIGGSAFYNCSKLTSVTIPNSVTSIGDGAFYDCTGLTSVTIPNSVTSIGDGAFYDCTGLTSVTIPNSVTSIGYYAFYKCSGLTSITIPNSVTSIGDYAFYKCSGLTSITIPNSVTSIGDHAFYSCSGLTSITIGNSVTSIGERAFSGCSGLTSISVENGNEEYDSRDNCNAIIETASNTLIAGCKNTTIPNSVTSIGSYAFASCSGLTSVTIPNSVTSIGVQAFYECSGLTSVTIPNSVTSIGNYAFYLCRGLTSVTIPNSVTSIGDGAFGSCSGLKEVKSDISVPFTFVYGAFIGISSNCVLVVPYGTKDAYIAKGWTTSIFGGGIKEMTYIVDGIYYGFNSNNKQATVTAGENKYSGNVIIPSSVTYNGTEYSVTCIGDSAFYSCDGLTSVTIPNSVTSIGNYAFYGCSGLTSVTIPNSVTSIGNYAFYGCSGLTSIEIPNSVTSIGNAAFANCIELADVYCYAEQIPTTGNDVFKDSYINFVTLYVPASAANAYKTTTPWSGFGTIVALPEPTLRGDVNGDGIVNGTDIQAVINVIVDGEYDEKADVNEDGQVNGTDIQEVINIIVNAE